MLAFCFIRLVGKGICKPISDLSPSSFAAPALSEHDVFLTIAAAEVNPSRCLNS